MTINYDNRSFRSIGNSENGEAGHETLFHYHQEGSVVWGEYAGGQVLRGQLIAHRSIDGSLDMRYQHVNRDGKLMTGMCRSSPEILPDGRLRLIEKWQWTSGDRTKGESVLEEVTERPL